MIILNLVATLAAAGAMQAGPASKSVPWPEAMAADAAAKAHTTSKARSKPVTVAVRKGTKEPTHFVGADPYLMSPEERRAWDQANREFSDNWQLARNQMKLQNWASARDVLEGYLASRELGRPAIAELLADVYFHLKQPDQAFAVLGPFCTSSADDHLLLRASLAAARRGVVYSGQRAFVLRNLGKSFPDVAANYPQGNSASAVEVMTCIALGEREVAWDIQPRYYLSEAIRLDPGNPVANWSLGRYELSQHHFQAAAQLFRAGLPRANGDLLKQLRKDLGDAEYLKGQGRRSGTESQ